MQPVAIEVKNLTKTFTFSTKTPGVSWWRNLFMPLKKEVPAVSDISFSVTQGERIAFIGPNGAGKSTTIKMLTGILFPTSGHIRVLGLDPTRDRKKLAYRIGTVFGQRSQLFANLPLTDSLEFFGVMYDLSARQIHDRMEELIVLFDLSGFASQPVRKLSLGQRMRAEVAASLMHHPEILFLDEPTIGLDVVAKKSLRDLLLKINKEQGTTVFLTSHDVGDIESLAGRTIVVNHGTIVKDLPTRELSNAFLHEKYVDLIPTASFSEFPDLPAGIRYRLQENQKITVMVDLSRVELRIALRTLLELFDIKDLNVYSIDLETVIRDMYERP